LNSLAKKVHDIKFYVEDQEKAVQLFGHHEEHLKALEQKFDVQILARGCDIVITGDGTGVHLAYEVLQNLLLLLERGDSISIADVNYLADAYGNNMKTEVEELSRDVIIVTARGKQIKPKTIGQKQYVDAIRNHDVTIGIGPAGTGKTYLAMAMAIAALRKKEVSRLILTRPAVEAGERLGFLPGDLQEKVNPYLRPLYDALYDILGPEGHQKYVEKGIIEIAPLAYMRGRTLDGAFVVLDEAQNTTSEQMKMFLTRLGFGSKMAVIGDITQIDLTVATRSGLVEASSILKDVPGIGFAYLTANDVVRHPLVQKIIGAYETHEQKEKEQEK
jgi:phosphate starvation-inducible PhoH-like protein